MVIPANTIAHPRTVMIHPLNTDPANFTVMRPDGLYFLTFETVADPGQRFYLIAKHGRSLTSQRRGSAFCVWPF
jgi:hypothetical protein